MNIAKKIKSVDKKNLAFILAFIVIASIGAYLFLHRESTNGDPADRDRVLRRLNRIMILPEGEEPFVGTVDNPEEIAHLPLFTRAQRGDRIVVYSGASKAILFRPSTGQIVDVRYLMLDNDTGSVFMVPEGEYEIANFDPQMTTEPVTLVE
ncbi:MAG: hypothetical protein LBG64_04170 [Pseudomonadales bacterium]|jgi:hypothetical protein|nr:hypothetical protein [Pseudomonadales bacterium]